MQLPPSSRLRRRKISAVGIADMSHGTHPSDIERSLGTLLDTTLVGRSNIPAEETDIRMDEWKDVSQKGDDSCLTISNGVAGYVESQALVSECGFTTF